ncbi:unnamed protein product [Boreogadus saida]
MKEKAPICLLLTYEAGRSLTEKRQIRRDAKKFTLKGNCMYYLGENGLSMRRVILTEKEKDEAMMDIFYTHGAPEVILTDQGREFWNKVEYLHI